MAFSTDINPYVLRSDELPEHLGNHRGKPEAWDLSLENFSKLFALYPERCLELGSGSGEHLLRLAERETQQLCIGMEWRYKRAYRTAEKGLKSGIPNFFVFRADFQKLLEELIPANSLQAIYMNFPDPWAKNRWKKHRPLAKDFFKLLSSRMKMNGCFALKTDHAEYFESLLQFLNEEEEIGQLFEITAVCRDLYQSEWLETNIPTEFEKLFLSQNLPIFSLRLKKNC